MVPISVAEALDGLDLEIIYDRTDWRTCANQERLRAAEKFELLIPTSIPLEYILNLHG